MSDDDEESFNLLRAIARSEGLKNKNNKIKGYLPLFKHPLPVSDNRHEHESVLKRVLSCKLEYQGIASITLGDAWSLEEVYMRSGRIVLTDRNGSSPLHLAVQMNSIDCIMVLINIGVELSGRNDMGFTPMFIAHSAGFTQLVQLLRENNALMFVEPKHETPSGTILDVYPEVHSSSGLQSGSGMERFLNLPQKGSNY